MVRFILCERERGYAVKFTLDGQPHEIKTSADKNGYRHAAPMDFPRRRLPLNVRSLYDAQLNLGEENLKFIDAHGATTGKICVGDSVEKILASGGRLYVSYFDEGVFGDFGWDEPPGECGLAVWSETGEKLYEFDRGLIDDCCAINLFDGAYYVRYYSSFDFARIKDGFVTKYPLKSALANQVSPLRRRDTESISPIAIMPLPAATSR